MTEIPTIELELLLLCSRSSIAAGTASRIEELTGRVDWNVFVSWVQRHGVGSLILRTLGNLHSAKVPLDVVSLLRTKSERLRAQNLVFAQEAHRVFQALERAGVTAAGYKGAALSAFLYADSGLRESSDVDLLVRPRDALTARKVLLQNGFVARGSLRPAFERLYATLHCSFPLSSGRTGVLIDLNWRTAPWYWRLPGIPELAWSTLRTVNLAGREIPWFTPEHVLWVICMHGSMHKWELLKWIVDVAELVRGQPHLDWAYVEGLARRTGSERMLGLGLLLAVELLDAPVPRDVLARVRRQDVVVRLAEQVYRKVFAPARAPVATTEELRFISQAMRGMGAKATCWLLIPAYFFLHRCIRPCLAGLRRIAAGA